MSAVIVSAALVAGALGALLRYAIGHAFSASPKRLPWAVFIVNLVGCFVAGIVLAIVPWDPEGSLRLIVLGGFAGGLTTFSTFSVETVQLALTGRWRAVIGFVLGNIFGGFAAFAAGWWATAIPVLLGFILLG